MKYFHVPSLLLLSFTVIILTGCSKEEIPLLDEDFSFVHPDSVEFSFVFVGCNRIDRHDKHNPNTDSSTANLSELRRTFEEVSKLQPKPDMFFFLGDMVLGLDKDPNVLKKELSSWVTEYKASPVAKAEIELIAVPGNHEMLYYDKDANGELPLASSLPVWIEQMGDFVPNVPLNRVTGSDSLINRATYSFQHKNTHFIVMNTDTYNSNKQIGQICADWIVDDIQKARQDSTVKHIFLLGYKPVWLMNAIASAESGIDVSQAQEVWDTMEAHSVEAMLSAHWHRYDRSQPNPGKSYQVVAGNGGSPYSYTSNTSHNHQFFGYSITYVMKNGTIKLCSMGRTVLTLPESKYPRTAYLDPLPDSVKTTPRDTVDISWGTTAPKWQW